MDAFSAMADQNRRAIVTMLAEHGEMTATEIVKGFKISAPAVSQHLKVLREAKLVRMKKEAQRRLYSIERQGFNELSDFVTDIRRLWEERFDRLDEYLQGLQQKGVSDDDKKD